MFSKSRFIPILLLFNLLLRVIVALRPLKYIDGLTLPDDTYLALTIARNIARGLGPLYSLDFTNGFQPLYVFLSVPLYWLFPDNPVVPVHGALLILALFDTATLYILYRLVAMQSKSPLTPLVAAVAWIFNPYVIRTTVNGLETAIAMFFIVLAYYYYSRFKAELGEGYKPTFAFAFGLILGLAMLARIDNVILAGVVALFMLYDDFRRPRSLPAIFGKYALIGLGIIFTILPWTAYSHHYTGDLVPVSGPAVRYMSLANVDHSPTLAWHIDNLKWAVGSTVKNNVALLLVLGGLFAVSGPIKRRLRFGDIKQQLARHNPILLFCVLITLAYLFYVFGDWNFKRYLYPLAFLLLLYLASFFDLYLASLASEHAKRRFAQGTIFFLILAFAANPETHHLYFSRDTTTTGYMNIGLWAKERFPDGTVIGSSQSGALGYFADNLTVVNLDGVVNKACFSSLVEKRNIEYIRQTGIEYVVGWDVNIGFIARESANFRPDDLYLIEKVDGFRSWGIDWWLYGVKR